MTDTMSHFKSLGLSILAGTLLLSGAAAPATAAPGAKKKERPATRLITVKAPQRAGGAIRLQVRILRNLDRLSVKVNGRRLRSPLPVTARRHLALHLDATKGVRFGRNRVLVRAFRGKRRQTVVRTSRVRTDAPLVGVRIPRHARQHDPVTLNARPTRARNRGKLAYRWRIVGAPRRAHARLKGARNARPRLRASHQGRYLLALTVSQRRGGASASAAKRCPVTGTGQTPPSRPIAPAVNLPDNRPIASTPLEKLPDPPSNLSVISPASALKRPPVDRIKVRPASAPGCTTQYVSVEIDPAIGPIGVAFDSRATVGGETGMRVGSNFYPVPAGQTEAVFLDANTLEELGTTIVPAGQNAEAWATLMSAQYVIEHQVLILLSGPGFTLVKGATEGDDTAISNEGLVEGDGKDAPLAEGQIQGWLQPSIPVGSTDQSYRFVSPDRISVNTGQGTGQSNTMTVGGQNYDASLPAGTEAGFHVLVTDPALRPILGTPAFFSTNTGDPALDAQQQGALANLLARANATTASTVIMQSIGSPRPTTEASLIAGQQIQKMGGSEWMFLSLDGTTGYALIANPPALGAADNDQPAAEASAKWTTEGGNSLQGLLKRRHDGAYQATLADAVGAMDFSLQQIAFQSPVAWPQTDTPGKRAAGVWIAQQLDIPRQGPGLCASTPQPDVRAEYCNLSLAPGTLLREIRTLVYPQDETAFSEDEFNLVANQLKSELGQVKTIRTAIAAMQVPFALANGSTAIGAQQIGANVIKSIPEKPQGLVSANLGLSAAVMYAAAETPVIGEAFGPFAAGLDLASDLTDNGAVPSPDWDIETTAAAAGATVDERLQTAYEALDSYSDILVSDSGKLSAAEDAAKNGWGQDADTSAEALSLLQLGVQQWLYTAIVPSAYDLVEIPGVDPTIANHQVHCVYSSAPRVWRPWLKADPATMFFPLNTWSGNGPAPGQLMGMMHGSVGDNRSSAIKAGNPLVTEMFGDAKDGDASLVPPWFYNRATWNVKHPTIVQPQTKLVPGVCKAGVI